MELEDQIGRADVIDISKLSGTSIKFGATVTLIPEEFLGHQIRFKAIVDTLVDGCVSGDFVLQLKDNGRDFDPGEHKNLEGRGLANMRARAFRVGRAIQALQPQQVAAVVHPDKTRTRLERDAEGRLLAEVISAKGFERDSYFDSAKAIVPTPTGPPSRTPIEPTGVSVSSL